MIAIKSVLKIQCWHKNGHKSAIKIFGQDISSKQKNCSGRAPLQSEETTTFKS